MWTPRPLNLFRHFHIFISFCSTDVHLEHNFSEEKASIDPTPRLAESLLGESQILLDGSPVVYKLSAELKLRREKGKIIKKSIGSPNELESRRTEKVLMVVAQREQERQRLSTAWSTTYWA